MTPTKGMTLLLVICNFICHFTYDELLLDERVNIYVSLSRSVDRSWSLSGSAGLPERTKLIICTAQKLEMLHFIYKPLEANAPPQSLLKLNFRV